MIYLFINVMSLLLVYYGIQGALWLEKSKIAIHNIVFFIIEKESN